MTKQWVKPGWPPLYVSFSLLLTTVHFSLLLTTVHFSLLLTTVISWEVKWSIRSRIYDCVYLVTGPLTSFLVLFLVNLKQSQANAYNLRTWPEFLKPPPKKRWTFINFYKLVGLSCNRLNICIPGEVGYCNSDNQTASEISSGKRAEPYIWRSWSWC